MANHRQHGTSGREQIIMSAPSRLLVERYLSPKGIRLHMNAKTKEEKKLIWDKYGKNRYRKNPDSIPLRNYDPKKGPVGKILRIYHT